MSVSPVQRLLSMVAMPLLVFALVLTAALVASRAVLLPRLTQVSVGGQMHAATDLRALQADLLSRVSDAEDLRNMLVRPMSEATFDAAKARRASQHNIMNVESDVKRLASSYDVDGKHVIVFTAFHIDGVTGAVSLSGDVRNVGPQSMTVLASFLDDLTKLPGVRDMSPGKFLRVDDPDIGPHSPFNVSFVLP